MTGIETLSEKLLSLMGDAILATTISLGELTITLEAKNLEIICTTLRDHDDFQCQQLIDICAVDYLTYGQAQWQTNDATSTGFGRGVTAVDLTADTAEDRFMVVYHLLSTSLNHRVRLHCKPDSQPPMVPSITSIFASANWYEREAFDLFGILFEGHPDMRRILTDYGFIGHPFRKDFPLSGHLEVRYDPQQQRVIYQPVTIEPRVLVPRVIRDDHRDVRSTSAGEQHG